MSFGHTLKFLRTENNITQQDLADYLKVSRPTIAGYETKGKEPDFNTLVRIADFFHISVDFLIREESHDSYEYDKCLKDSYEAILIEKISHLDAADLYKLINYVSLIECQPRYKKHDKQTKNIGL